MNSELSKRELFETVPVKKAVATLAVPTIISQIVTIIYNLADIFFVGQLNNPYMVAAVTVVSPWFNLLTALGNLFGIGGSSLISRLLGEKRDNEVKYVSSSLNSCIQFSQYIFLFSHYYHYYFKVHCL